MTEYDFWHNIGDFHEFSDLPCEYCVVKDYKQQHKDYESLCSQGCCEAIRAVYKRVMEDCKHE